MPVDIEFKAGDKVRMDLHLETFKALQNEYGGWADGMESVSSKFILSLLQKLYSNYIMVCLPLRGDSPRALASGLSPV